MHFDNNLLHLRMHEKSDFKLYDVPVDRSHFKVFTRVVPLVSIVVRGEFTQPSVKKTGAEVRSSRMRSYTLCVE